MAHIKFYIGCALILFSALLTFLGKVENSDLHAVASLATAVVFLLLDKIESVNRNE